MTPLITLRQREKELRDLIATAAGRKALEDLASRYIASNGRARPKGTSVITYILVHEREQGLLSD